MSSVFSINTLTEVELDDYMKGHFGETEEYKKNQKKESLTKGVHKLISEQNKILLELTEIKDAIPKEQYNKALFYGKSALKKVNHTSYKLRKLLSELGYEEDLTTSTYSDIYLEGAVEEGILHIILPELLPDKVKQGESRRYAEITHMYMGAFKNFFKERHFPIYEQKAVLVFLNYYTSELSLKDHDNFETKQIIDILSVFLLPDDNPKWCANYMDSMIGEYNHTEIYVVPYSKYIEFFQKKIFVNNS